jgi:DNA-binding transcriptional MerR regulator
MNREYTVRELANAIGVQPSTIHRYLQAGVLPKPPVRGRLTRYSEEHLVRARAISEMTSRKLSFETIKERLELEAAARAEAEAKARSESAPVGGPDGTMSLAGAERWSRIALLPGLDLVLRDGATELVQRIASEIAQRYAST